MTKTSSLLVVVCLFTCRTLGASTYSGNGETRDYWSHLAQADIERAQMLKPNHAVAKNVILFLGDGMGVSTVTAARILKGQQQNKTGEETVLSFDKFPHVGLSKTYNQNAQTPDSAGTATAYLCGVKTNKGVLGVDARSRRQDCSSIQGAELTSILDWSLTAGKSVGFVSTARVTHATPGALYANTPERDWESDSDMPDVGGECRDIARQLIEDYAQIQVILGGGRRSFLRFNDTDPESGDNSQHGRRDGRNLVQEWQATQAGLGRRYKYVWNETDFRDIDPETTDTVLGLFNPSHMEYVLDSEDDVGGEPSIEEMTEMAVRILRKNPRGYFLMVEGGRIDHGHHSGQAAKALTEVIAMEKAVEKTIVITDQSETLVIVSADHSHVFSISGYPERGNPIFGLVNNADNPDEIMKGNDNLTYTTLVYGNGPGAHTKRANLTGVDTGDKDFKQQSVVPLDSETHAGEDVAIYAVGPKAHMFHSVHEQNYIAHVMAYASCVGEFSASSHCGMSDSLIGSPETNKGTNKGTTFERTSFHFVSSLLIVLYNLVWS